jgi:hypothetical protein
MKLNLDSYKIPEAKIDELTFPESAKQKFLEYLKHLQNPSNPYHAYKDMRFAVAYKMADVLTEALTNKDEHDDAQKILEAIASIRKHKDPTAFVVHNFPVDGKETLLDTPSDPNGFNSDNTEDIGKTGYVTEWAMLAFNTASGSDIYQSPKEQGGLMTHHVTARYGKADVPSNAGAGVFPVHTEGSHLPTGMVDALTLATLKNEKTPTVIIPTLLIKEALQEKLGEKFNMLFEKRFKFLPGPVQEGGETDDHVIEPMIYKDDEGNITRWRLNANLARITAADPNDKEAQQIIEQVADTLESLKQGYVSQHGDFIFVGNRVGAAHSRTPFAPEDMGNPKTNRHLLRQQTMKSDSVKENFRAYVESQNGNNTILKYIK